MSRDERRPGFVESDSGVASAKEHALRQLEHLRREIDYDYPAVQIRLDRSMANRAVMGYIRALDDRAREQRKARR